MSRSLPVVEAAWLGRVPYREVWDLQRALVQEVRAGRRRHTILLLEHPHVFTMGRRGVPEHLLWEESELERREVDVVWSDRGGDATYHGPGQLVGYPIFELPGLGSDILRHLRALEDGVIAYLAALDITAKPGGKGLTGVWGEAGKLAAIGVKFDHGVTSHGFALNLTTDLDYFGGIVPCGLVDKQVTSVEAISGRRIRSQTAARALLPHLARSFGVATRWIEADSLAGLAGSAPPEPPPPAFLQVLKRG